MQAGRCDAENDGSPGMTTQGRPQDLRQRGVPVRDVVLLALGFHSDNLRQEEQGLVDVLSLFHPHLLGVSLDGLPVSSQSAGGQSHILAALVLVIAHFFASSQVYEILNDKKVSTKIDSVRTEPFFPSWLLAIDSMYSLKRVWLLEL